MNRNKIAELFDQDVKTIGKHINNALCKDIRNTARMQQNHYLGNIIYYESTNNGASFSDNIVTANNA